MLWITALQCGEMPHFAPRELLTLSSRVISRRTRALGSASSGAWTPEGAEVVAQGEEEAAETEEEEDAPEWFDLREIHEKELADDEEERIMPPRTSETRSSRSPAKRSAMA